MKLKFIALLRTSFASKGFNAKELESLADLVIAQNLLTDDSTDEDLATAVTAAKPTADFVQSVASRQVSDVKKPAPVETPKPVAPVVEPEIPTTTDPVLLALLAEIKEMKTGLTNLNTEKVANTRRDQYAKALEGTSEAYKKEALEDFDLLNFKDDEHYSGWLERKSESAKVFAQEETNGGLGGERPVGGVGGKPSDNKVDPAVASFIKKSTAERTAGHSENA